MELSRYWNDSGRDIWAVMCDGDESHTVVVEVKHYTKKVGIEIVDRLNGIRDRSGAVKGMIVTNSAFTKPAVEAYTAKQDCIGLVDCERLVGMLQDRSTWASPQSGLRNPGRHGSLSSEESNETAMDIGGEHYRNSSTEGQDAPDS